jgi:hypothetical protein
VSCNCNAKGRLEPRRTRIRHGRFAIASAWLPSQKNFAPPGPLVSGADRWRDDAELERQQADALFDPVKDLSGRMDLLHRERQGVVEVRAQLP